MTFSSIWIGMQDFTARPPCERAISRLSSRTSCDIEDGLIEPGILKSDFVSVAANPAVKPVEKVFCLWQAWRLWLAGLRGGEDLACLKGIRQVDRCPGNRAGRACTGLKTAGFLDRICSRNRRIIALRAPTPRVSAPVMSASDFGMRARPGFPE
jgi:hypothetical protein